jgi:2-amino-4-hydroxy-6-hydroxymethyldihydropteridine diphosphokinase
MPDRPTRKCVLALGSNLGDGAENIREALRRIEQLVGPISSRSTTIVTQPLLHPDSPIKEQPPYHNMVAVVETSLEPLELLRACRDVEKSLGRDRTTETLRWQPRTLDVDIICIEDAVIDLPSLQVPHPEMHKRAFVIDPMNEVWPTWRHPTLKKSVSQIARALRGTNHA